MPSPAAFRPPLCAPPPPPYPSLHPTPARRPCPPPLRFALLFALLRHRTHPCTRPAHRPTHNSTHRPTHPACPPPKHAAQESGGAEAAPCPARRRCAQRSAPADPARADRDGTGRYHRQRGFPPPDHSAPPRPFRPTDSYSCMLYREGCAAGGTVLKHCTGGESTGLRQHPWSPPLRHNSGIEHQVVSHSRTLLDSRGLGQYVVEIPDQVNGPLALFVLWTSGHARRDPRPGEWPGVCDGGPLALFVLSVVCASGHAPRFRFRSTQLFQAPAIECLFDPGAYGGGVRGETY